MGPVRNRARRSTLLAVSGLALLFLVGVAGTRSLLSVGEVLPGVEVAGLELGGLQRDEARAALAQTFSERLGEPLVVRVGAGGFSIEPGRLLRPDVGRTEALAFATGRESLGSRLLVALWPGERERELEPVLVLQPRARTTLSALLRPLTRTPRAAQVLISEGEATVVPDRKGTRVELRELLRSIELAALSSAGSVRARIEVARPRFTTAEAVKVAAEAELLLSAPVALSFQGERIAELDVETLERLVMVDGGRAAVDPAALAAIAEPLLRGRLAEPLDASFEIVGGRVRVIPSQGGTRLATRKAAEAVLAAGLSPGGRVAELELARRPAALTTREAKALGIQELVSEFTTDMGASSSNRIHNVHLMADILDGRVIRPSERFSFNEVVGPRTSGRGFLEGQMIVNGILLPSIGGGVCQVATTVFNAAFEAGLPVEARINHSFYIGHYPVGRDATVSWGGPDLVFVNDLEHALLVKSSYTDETLTVRFWGTDQGRRVEARTTQPASFSSPRLQYALDPTAEPKSVRLTKGGGPGFNVTVYRQVFEGGKLLRRDSFFSRYTPENPTLVFGPGIKKKPKSYFVLPTSG